MGLEEIRELLYEYIDQFGLSDIRTVKMSELLDIFIFNETEEEVCDLCKAVGQ